MPSGFMNKQAMPQGLLNPQPQGGLGGFLGNNSSMLMNLGAGLLDRRQNANVPMSQIAQSATLGSAFDTKRKDKNLTARLLVTKGLAANEDEAMQLMASGAANDLITQAMKPKVSEWKAVDGQLAQIGPDGSVKWHSGPNGPGGSVDRGLNPQYGVDDEGNPVLLQLGKDGTAVQTQMPEGIQLSKTPIKLDAGTHFVLLDPITRQSVGVIPKDIEGAASAEVRGKQTGEAQMELGGALTKAQQGIDLIDQLIAHPGRSEGTGASSWIDPRNYLAGTDATNFHTMNRQLEGKAFLEAFESLKGGGQITEVEGRKATEAIARLNTAQSDEAYVEALQELKAILRVGMDRSRQRAGQSPASQPEPAVRRFNPATGRIE